MILAIEDARETQLLLREVLGQAGFLVAAAHTGRDGLSEVRNLRPDVVLLDAMLPDLAGIEVLRVLKADPAVADIPVIAVSGRVERETLTEYLHAGAQDFVQKPFDMQELIARVTAASRIKQATDELRDRNDRLVHVVNTDPVTGLANRRQFDSVIDGLLAVERELAVLAVAAEGDDPDDGRIVRIVAAVNPRLGTQDTLARSGPRELLVAAPDADEQSARGLCFRLRSALDGPVRVGFAMRRADDTSARLIGRARASLHDD